MTQLGKLYGIDIGGTGGVSDHGSLTGLIDDDHTQYLLADGSRSMSGTLLPSASGAVDIGSAVAPFGHVYANDVHVSGDTLYIGGAEIKYNDTDILIPHTISGVTPTQDYHIATRSYANEKLKWAGEWATSTSYSVNDFIEYDNDLYVCSTAHVSSPGNSPVGGGTSNYLSGWDPAKRFKLEIDSSLVDDSLSYFPVMVRISSSAGKTSTDLAAIFDEVGANSLKIAVCESDQSTQCYVEIEKWDNGNEEAILWVRVPTVSSSSTTTLYLYYDNSNDDNSTYVGVRGSTPGETVWKGDDDYRIVYHMDGDTSTIEDSTENGTDGTKQAAAQPSEVNALTGKGQNFVYPDYVDIANDVITRHLSFTVEGMYNFDTLSSQDGGAQRLWTFRSNGANTDVAAQADGSITYRDAGTVQHTTSTPLSTSTWHHVAIVKDSGTFYIYVDGDVYAHTSGGIGSNSDRSILGCAYSSGYKWGFDGKMDEVRGTNAVRSAAWLKASCHSNKDNLVTYTFDSQSVNNWATILNLNTALTTLSGDITNSIVLDHGGLTGLADDDHTQYLLVNGGRSFTGTLSGTGVDLTEDIKFNSTPSSNLEYSGITVDGITAGINAFAQPVYLKSDGNWEPSNANSINTMPCAGLTTSDSVGAQKIFTYGVIRYDSWDWTPGNFIYIAASAGELTETAVSGNGDQVQVVGIATHADRIFFNPNYVVGEMGDDFYYLKEETYSAAEIDTISGTLDSKISTLSGALQTNIDGKSDVGHTHDGRYYTETELNNGQLDSRYYTETEVDNWTTNHTAAGSTDHDNRYYTETELNNGQLDNRYYTEIEVDTISDVLSAEIDNDIISHSASGDHDGRYYTEAEVDTISGALSAEIDNDIITHASNTSAHHAKYTDEEAQNAVGTIISGAGNVSVIYDDSTPLITISGSGLTTASITYENLNANGDVGTGPNQVAQGDHLHDGRYHTKSEIITISGDIISQIPIDYYTTGEVDTISGVIVNQMPTDYYTTGQVDTISGALSSEIDNDITTHAASGDHDGRYYTEAEITTISGDIVSQIPTDYISESEMTTISGDIVSQIPTDYYTTGEIATISGDIVAQIPTDYYTTGEIATISGDIVNQIITDHGNLSGLLDDDHPQYLLGDGSRTISGSLIPTVTSTGIGDYDLGSSDNPWRALYLDGTNDLDARYYYGSGRYLTEITISGIGTWHYGSGTPGDVLGNNDDFYIDVDTGDIYKKGFIAIVSGTQAKWNSADKHDDITLTNNDLTAQATGAGIGYVGVRADKSISSGKWYWEYYMDFNSTASTALGSFGVCNSSHSLGQVLGNEVNGWALRDGVTTNSRFWYNAGAYGYATKKVTTGDIIGIAIDTVQGKMWFAVNGVWQDGESLTNNIPTDPSVGSNPAFSNLVGTLYPAMSSQNNYGNGVKATARFDSIDFTYDPPEGFNPFSGTYNDYGWSKIYDHSPVQENLTISGSVAVPDGESYYIGNATTSGSWRITRSGESLKFQWYDGGSWNDGSVTVNRS